MPASPSTTGLPAADRVPPTALAVQACGAIALPTLIAFNVPPSATFLNQAAAFIGWGLWALMLCAPAAGPAMRWPWAAGRAGLGGLLGALALLALAAAAAPLWTGQPWTLALSSIGTLAAAALLVVLGAAVTRAGRAPAVFDAVCVALVVAGTAGALIGAVQVFAPQWTDGSFVAQIANGCAAGNLRQPNHLSSLLLWSLVALVWLAERRLLVRAAVWVPGLLMLAGVVLSASRTGMIGVLLLGGWGLLDRRLSRRTRALLLSLPVLYALLWLGLAAWAHHARQVFGGDAQFAKEDISSSRFAIWANTLVLIARHPWWGVGWGEFNFAWTLTPFPDRPVAFFDHTHNLVLQFAVELGLPLAALVLALLAWALWQAFRAGAPRTDADSADGAATALCLRAAFLLVLLMAVHSQLEYPLWYAHFLLTTAFAFGLCLGGPWSPAAAAGQPAPGGAGALRAGALVLLLGGCAALYDYTRVVVIFAPRPGGPPLAERIADGRRSVFFGHHADYADVTTEGQQPDPQHAFERVTHYLLDTRLMMAWSRALNAAGQTDAARHVAQRLREFRNPDAEAFFEVCDLLEEDAAAPDAPFQCQPPGRVMDYREFR